MDCSADDLLNMSRTARRQVINDIVSSDGPVTVLIEVRAMMVSYHNADLAWLDRQIATLRSLQKRG